MHTKYEGKVRNIAGVFLAGKNTLVDGLVAKRRDVRRGIAKTTRPRRDYEQNGVDYHFCLAEQFQTEVEDGMFLEYADIWGGYCYGTPLGELGAANSEGKHLLTLCDVQGVDQLFANCVDVRCVFLDIPEALQRERYALRPGSAETLEERIAGSVQERQLIEQLRRQYPGQIWVVVNDGTVEAALEASENFLFD